MTDRYKFDDLTRAQQALLSFQGWRPELKALIRQPSARTTEKLIQRGQLVREIEGKGLFQTTTYSVPLDVHAAWCAYCAEKELTHE